MPSIEILVEGPRSTALAGLERFPFAICLSNPPTSHRQPSLWQRDFSQIGGVLCHIGEPRFKGQVDGWYYAYDLLDEHDCEYFRMKPIYRTAFANLLSDLLHFSRVSRIHFTTDWQLGKPTPSKSERGFPLGEFLDQHDAYGIPFNSWITLQGDASSSSAKTDAENK
jgi:hypothetical protein